MPKRPVWACFWDHAHGLDTYDWRGSYDWNICFGHVVVSSTAATATVDIFLPDMITILSYAKLHLLVLYAQARRAAVTSPGWQMTTSSLSDYLH